MNCVIPPPFFWRIFTMQYFKKQQPVKCICKFSINLLNFKLINMILCKKFRMTALVVIMAFTVPFQSNAASTLPSDSLADSRIAAQITLRVNEIQDMDKTNLTASEKRGLKKELRDMKKQASGLDSRVYLSIGAIIIIILILILIL